MLMKNTYVRATTLVLLITILLGAVQANVKGLIGILALSGSILGSFLVITLLVVSVISLISGRVRSKAAPGPAALGSISQSSVRDRYKKGLIWSLILATPGVFLWVLAALTTRNGGGEAFLIAIPLFFVSFAALFAALLYGIAYLLKRDK